MFKKLWCLSSTSIEQRSGKSQASVRGRAKEDEPMEEKSLEHEGKGVAKNDAKGDAGSKPVGEGHKDESQGVGVKDSVAR